MAVVITKTPSIQNLDAIPILNNTAGEGGPAFPRVNNDTLTGNVGDSIGSIYRFVRVPTIAKIKRLWVAQSVSTGTSAGDIGIAYSDSPTDGTQQAFSSRANPMVLITASADNKMFGSALALNGGGALPIVPVDRTYQSTFTFAMTNQPLWAALVAAGCIDFSTDPGGFFDIAIKLTAAVATNPINYQVLCEYVAA